MTLFTKNMIRPSYLQEYVQQQHWSTVGRVGESKEPADIDVDLLPSTSWRVSQVVEGIR